MPTHIGRPRLHLGSRAPDRQIHPMPAVFGFLLALAVALTVTLVGCGTPGVGQYRLRAIESDAMFSPALEAVAYRADDKHAAVFILTDLPIEALRPGTPVAGLTGNIVQINLFIRPFPGRTPISVDAFNAAITHVVLANGQIGVYGGGGFMQPRGDAGDTTLGGHMTSATLRLTAQTRGFVDRLGTSELDVSFRAPREPGLAELAERRIAQLVAAADRNR